MRLPTPVFYASRKIGNAGKAPLQKVYGQYHESRQYAETLFQNINENHSCARFQINDDICSNIKILAEW
jgi:hypothetical protein